MLTNRRWRAKAAEQVAASLAVAAQVRAQDVTADAAGQPVLRQGVAKDRRISVEDADMRHGRKSASRLIDGYKRHVMHDLDSALVRAVGLTAANAPEAGVTDAIMADLAEQQVVLGELHIDRAYLSSTLVRERTPDLAIYCKAWPVRHGPHFAKTAFTLDWERQTLRCPHESNCLSNWAGSYISQPPRVPLAPCGHNVPRAPVGGV